MEQEGSRRCKTGTCGLRLAVLVWLSLCIGVCATAAAAPPRPRPTWESIETTVASYFSAIPGYRSGDIISRNQVQPLLVKLASLGWKVPAADQLLEKVPADQSWLVVHLRTPAGTKFMRQIARYPRGYDCTDRLASISGGQDTVAALIRGPGGEKMIQYLTTTRYGKNMGRELSQVPGGADFTQPTGKIYTSADLLAELTQLYAEPAQAPAKSTPARRARSAY